MNVHNLINCKNKVPGAVVYQLTYQANGELLKNASEYLHKNDDIFKLTQTSQ